MTLEWILFEYSVREGKLKYHEKSSIYEMYNGPRAGIIFATFPMISLINNQVVQIYKLQIFSRRISSPEKKRINS